jgi:hypothetical protein
VPPKGTTKLTATVQEAICEAIRSLAPMHWAARYAGVDDDTVRLWRHTATRALEKKARQRSQHERRCIALFGAMSDAESRAFVFGTTLISNAALPTILTETTTTTSTKDGVTTTTSVRKERQVAGDWHAIAHLMARLHPREMGDRFQIEGTPGGEPVRVVTVEDVWDELEALRRAEGVPDLLGPSGNGSEA